MAKHAIRHIERSSTDLERAKNFFAGLFGWRFAACREDYPVYQPPEGVVAGIMKAIRLSIVIMMVFIVIAVSAQENNIYQIKKGSITIDGNLEEWPIEEWIPVSTFSSGASLKPSPDIDVKVAFAFDSENFYLAVRAFDDVIETVDRSWRYGDGFFFTLVTDEGKEKSSYVYQYGFDQNGKWLVFRNGEYFPSFDSRDVEFKFKQHDDHVDYEIAIPYKLLKPFNPFTYKKAAINLIYADRDNEERTIIMLSPDNDFDTESTNQRAGEFFTFRPLIPESDHDRSFHITLQKNFFRTGEDINIRYAINLNENKNKWMIKAKLTQEDVEKQREERKFDFKRALNLGDFALKIGDLASGNYMLNFIIRDETGKEVFDCSDEVFILNNNEIENYKSKIATYKNNKAVAASLSNLEIRFQWFDEFFQKPNYEDISSLNEWKEDILELLAKLKKGDQAVFGNNVIKRYAHRSKIDDTLQPYSVFIPETCDSNKKYPLIVALHGSGVDERGFFRWMVKNISYLEYPMIAPKARGLSDWYVGNSGEDVFECIEHMISLFPNIRRDRIFLFGFSMGGYGTWRLGLLRPNYFRGLIIGSGALVPPQGVKGENILEIIDRVKDENILIIHGDKDNAVPIDNTRKAVKKLKALNANFEYIEVPGAGHGNYDKNKEIVKWIKKYSE
jgi:predicted peptidase